jgi:hypothetical protein
MTAGIASFLFSFGNVRSVAIMLGVPGWIQPLISPAVDVSVVGLIVVIQFLITAGIHPRRLRAANTLLIAAGVAMMAANVAPSLVLAATGHGDRYYGRAALDAVTPALLIAWAHVGPKLVHLFVEVREKARSEARQVDVERTLATEADRAAAAAALTEALAEAERLRTEASEELAAAASVRQREAEAAQLAEQERTRALRELAERMDEQERTTLARLANRERTSETDAARRTREAELLAQRAQAELTEARRIAEAAAAERTAAAEDRRAAEELLASVPSVQPPSVRRERTERTRPEPAGDGGTVTSVSGRMSVAQRVDMWKSANPGWSTMPTPSQQDLKDFFPGLSSADTISKIRQRIDEDKKAA